MNKKTLTLRQKTIRMAVAAALPALCMGSNANAACTVSANNAITNCSGILTSPITAYDAAAAYQPISGSNSYTPANPAFPASTNPATPGYNPNPATVTINLDGTTVFNVTATSASGGGIGNDKGLISANYSNSESVNGGGVNNWTLNNAGTIGITSPTLSSGRLSAVLSDSQVNVFSVNNAAPGNINATQLTNITAPPATDYQLTFSSTKLTTSATDGSSGSAIAVTSGIYTDDNTNTANITNAGKISASGSFSADYYGRADTTIINTGTIQNTSWTSTGSKSDLATNNGVTGHWSIATWGGTDYATVSGSNPDTPISLTTGKGSSVALPVFSKVSGNSGGLLTSFSNTQSIYNIAIVGTSGLALTNSGTIQGDILALDTTPTTWAAAQAQKIDPSYMVSSGTSTGPRDSNVVNSGIINGNIFLGSGTHNWNNSGTINGNINVNQGGGLGTFSTLSTATPPANFLYTSAGASTSSSTGAACPASGGTNDPFCATTTTVLAAFAGGQVFNLANSGVINGNITITNLMSTSQITLSPTIKGSGAGSSAANPSTSISGINGALIVNNASLATTPLLGLGYSAGNANNVMLNPVIPSGVTVSNGAWFIVANSVSGNVLSSTALPTVQSSPSGLISWKDAINGAGNLVIGASVNTTSATIPGMSSGGQTALTNLLQFSSATGSTVENLATSQAVRNAAEQLRPEINGATVQSALGIVDKIFGLIDTHLTNISQAQFNEKNSAAPDEQTRATNVWMPLFGFHGNQNTRLNVDGYTVDSYGIALGSDTLISTNTRVGGTVSYASTTIDDKGVNTGNMTMMNSYLGTAYGSTWVNGWYLNGALGLGEHNINSTRQVLGNSVSGNHSAWQYSAKANAGKPIIIGVGTVTPVASLTVSRLNQGGYTEQGIGALSVNSISTNSLRSGLGGKTVMPLPISNTTSSLELRAMWNHEFANTSPDTVASFVGGNNGTFTVASVRNARDELDFGTSLCLFGGDKHLQQGLVLNYDVALKDKYVSQKIALQAHFNF